MQHDAVELTPSFPSVSPKAGGAGGSVGFAEEELGRVPALVDADVAHDEFGEGLRSWSTPAKSLTVPLPTARE